MPKKFLRTIPLVLLGFLLFAFTSLSKDSDVHTADYYDVNVTRLFKEGNYAGGYKLLEEGLRAYPTATHLNKLMGRYYYQKKDYNNARFYLYRSVRADNANVEAKQLLATVEETTKNYSSAICYINELLEVNPYWKGLWIKKMNIFRKQGNDTEADRLLRRLVEIYPDDMSLRNRLNGRLEENLANYRKNGNSTESIATLRQMVNADPNNMENYVVLSNLLLQSGQRDEALAVVSQGLGVQPTNRLLAEKRVGILSEQHRYAEASDFIRAYQKAGGSGLTEQLTYLEEESARSAVTNDAYTMYARMYDRTHSSDALDFLLGTAVARGYTTDALFYIGEARKGRGDDPRLIYMEYEVYKQLGNTRKALPLLEKVVELQPSNTDAIDELCVYRLAEGVDMMVAMDYLGATEKLNYVIQHASDPETVKNAMNKKYTCLFETKRYTAASSLLDSIKTRFPDSNNYFARKTQLLSSQKKPEQALAMLEQLLNDSVSAEDRAFYLADYEEIAIPYIKELIDQGTTYKALTASENLLRLFPSSYYGLTYAMTSSGILKRHDEFDLYANMAAGYYPEDVDFSIKQTTGMMRRGEYRRALNQLTPWFASYPNDQSLISAYSGNAELYAQQLIKAHLADSAIVILDSALVHDERNKTLLYTKGLAYESLKEYDSAHHYLSYYEPSLMEFDDHKLRLEKIAAKGMNNQIAVEYGQARFGDQDVITSVASAGYTRKGKRNGYTATLNYAGRDGTIQGADADTYASGGFGLQGLVKWDREFNDKWTANITLGAASKYFPRAILQLGATKKLRNDWSAEGHLGIRLVESAKRDYRWNVTNDGQAAWVFDKWSTSYTSLVTLGGGVARDLETHSYDGKLDLMFYNGKLCFSAQARGRYYPMETRWLTLWATAGVGNAPEASILDSSLPTVFNKLNTNVGAGASYLLNRNITLGIAGTWSTFPSSVNVRTGTELEPVDVINSKYKNLFNINASLLLTF